MRIASLLLLCAACSSNTVVVEPPPADASSPDGSVANQDSSTPDDSAPAVDAAEAGSGPNEGLCAGCTAGMCLMQLEACDSTCAGALMDFNTCLGAHKTNCGTTFASSGGPSAMALWACLSTKCASTCGTM